MTNTRLSAWILSLSVAVSVLLALYAVAVTLSFTQYQTTFKAAVEAQLLDLARHQLLTDHRAVNDALYRIDVVRQRRPLTQIEQHWFQRLDGERQEQERLLVDLNPRLSLR